MSLGAIVVGFLGILVLLAWGEQKTRPGEQR